jgi:hypothetical protein
MKYVFVYFIGVITGFLLCYLLIKPEPVVIETEPIVIKYEIPVPYEVVKPVFVDKWHILTLYDTIDNSTIDTVYIIQDYFTAKIYRDTLYDKPDAFIFLQETVYQGGIRDRSMTFQNHRPPPEFLAVGGSLSTQSLSAGLILGKKQGVWYGGIGYGPKPFVQLGYFRKL